MLARTLLTLSLALTRPNYSVAALFQGLGDLSGGSYLSIARAISADSLVVVGQSNSDLGGEAVRWTLAAGMELLGNLPGGTGGATAWVTNFDGFVIVGQSNPDLFIPGGVAARVWDVVNCVRNLLEVLVNDLGLDLTGWVLTTAMDVSEDGSVITGTGLNPDRELEAWIAIVRPVV